MFLTNPSYEQNIAADISTEHNASNVHVVFDGALSVDWITVSFGSLNEFIIEQEE